jgi:lysophospholipase L1-like esterase
LSGIRRQVDLADPTVRVEPEFPQGTATSNQVPGDPYYVALGDSLAANVGVDDVRDGYVSRFHRYLEERDGAALGLRNFGIPGETSGSLLTGGQLDAAVEFAAANRVGYLTIDIGANDLLGHLGSADCSSDIETPACLERIAGALAAYEGNIAEIFDRLAELDGVTVIVLLAYNPFSFGFENSVRFESQSNQALRRLNDIAGLAALDRGFLVADGFSRMLNTATVTTRMLDNPPDIHPTPLGYDRLTSALVRALG